MAVNEEAVYEARMAEGLCGESQAVVLPGGSPGLVFWCDRPETYVGRQHGQHHAAAVAQDGTEVDVWWRKA